MLFGDQPYAGNYGPFPKEAPPGLKDKVLRAIRRVYTQDVKNIPFEYQVKAAIATVLAGSAVTGSLAKSVYDWGVSFANSPDLTPVKRGPPTPDTAEKPVLKKPHLRVMPKNIEFELDQDMDTDADVSAAVAVRSIGAQTSTNKAGAHETPIDKQRPHYGLPDTTTVVLPYTQYFTPVTFSDYRMVRVQFRINWPSTGFVWFMAIHSFG